MRLSKGLVTWSVCAAMLCTGFQGMARADDEQAPNVDTAATVETGGAIADAALAMQLAAEGQRRQSPILMLAATELLGGLVQSDQELEIEMTSEGEAGESDTEKVAVTLDVATYIELAQEYAAEDAELSAYVEARLEQLASRGLVWHQGQHLSEQYIGGETFKHYHCGEIYPGQTVTFNNVTFEGNRNASVYINGDGDGDLDLWIYDQYGNLIGSDLDYTSQCWVNWVPSWEGPFTIQIRNVGQVWENYSVLVNW